MITNTKKEKERKETNGGEGKANDISKRATESEEKITQSSYISQWKRKILIRFDSATLC